MKQVENHETRPGHGDGLERRLDDLRKIMGALQTAELVCKKFTCETVHVEQKSGGDPVTTLDRAVNECLLETLRQDDEGWLSEESVDDRRRIGKRRVWIVDPLDGTKEFLAGVPEWCVSIALIEDDQAVVGGICNPATDEIFLGSPETGIHRWLQESQNPWFSSRKKPLVLASRSEVGRGEWDWLKEASFEVRPLGSIAYKLALVAAGLADATWTFVPKSEWDIAAGVALVLSSGGTVTGLDGKPIVFNQPDTKRDGLVAFARNTEARLKQDFQDCLCHRSTPGIPVEEPARFASGQ